MSVPWALGLLWTAHLRYYTNLSGEDLLDTSDLLIFLKLSKGLIYFWLFSPFVWCRVGCPRRVACHALKWGRLSGYSLKIKLCRSTCSIPLRRKPGLQEQRWSRVYKMQFYFKWNSNPTTRNKLVLHKAVAGKGEYIFQANCKSSGNSWLTICSSDIKEKEETLSSTNHIFKNFPILLPVFVLVQQIVYRNKRDLLYLFRRKCLLYNLLALVCSFIEKQQEKGFCVKYSQGQGFLFLMLAASSLLSLTTVSKSVLDNNLVASLQGDISQLQVICSECKIERDFRTKLIFLYSAPICANLKLSSSSLLKDTQICDPDAANSSLCTVTFRKCMSKSFTYVTWFTESEPLIQEFTIADAIKLENVVIYKKEN